jgi:hypothetical protein
MKSNGSVYVAIVLGVLGGYFTYQWWFNPQRAIKRQLGNLAADLSVRPDSGADMDRLARIARLRNYFAPDAHVKMGATGPQLMSREAVVGAFAAWNRSAAGWSVDFVDVQITLDSDTTARAFMTVEVTTPDTATGQPVVDAREAVIGMAEQDGVWLITTAEPIEPVLRP